MFAVPAPNRAGWQLNLLWKSFWRPTSRLCLDRGHSSRLFIFFIEHGVRCQLADRQLTVGLIPPVILELHHLLTNNHLPNIKDDRFMFNLRWRWLSSQNWNGGNFCWAVYLTTHPIKVILHCIQDTVMLNNIFVFLFNHENTSNAYFYTLCNLISLCLNNLRNNMKILDITNTFIKKYTCMYIFQKNIKINKYLYRICIHVCVCM